MLGELRKYLQFCTPFHSVCQFTDETYVPLARWGSENVLGCLGCTSHRCSGESGAWHRFFLQRCFTCALLPYLCDVFVLIYFVFLWVMHFFSCLSVWFLRLCCRTSHGALLRTTTYSHAPQKQRKNSQGSQNPYCPPQAGYPKCKFFFKSRVYDYFSSFDCCVVCTRWVPL